MRDLLRRRPTLLPTVVVALLIAGCGGTTPPPGWTAGPTLGPGSSDAASAAPSATAPAASAAASAEAPAGILPLPAGTETAGVLLENAPGTFDRYRSIGRLAGMSDCTATWIDAGQAARGDQPAYVVAAGHCLGLLGPNEVLIGEEPVLPLTVTFDWFTDATARRAWDVRQITWATMKATDIAVLELAATQAALAGEGLEPFALRPDAFDGEMAGVNVGAPSSGIGVEAPYLRAGTCEIDGQERTIREFMWAWTEAVRAVCPDVYGGSSGSPILDPVTGELVAVINTTTANSRPEEDCRINRPCEVDGASWSTQEDTAYAMTVHRLAACFVDGRFDLAGGCELDPGHGAVADGTPMTANPNAPAFGDRQPTTTWRTSIAGDGFANYRTKMGPLGSIDCADTTGYGAPIALAEAPLVDDPLPTEAGVYGLCVQATDGSPAQEPRFASLTSIQIDTTPPPPGTVSIFQDDSAAWIVIPDFQSPEWAEPWVKIGPPATTDCEDPIDYGIFITIPPRLEGDDLPAVVCVQFFDDAGNKAPLIREEVPPTPG
jgi:hypothetical protein